MSPSPGLCLTPELINLCERPGLSPTPDPRWTPLEPGSQERLTNRLTAELGDHELWIFGYGSLIWSPTFSHVEKRTGTAHGWHRSFCIELTDWRGTPDQPGL